MSRRSSSAAPTGPEQARGSRIGDLRIRRVRPTRPSLLDRLASRLRGTRAG